MNIAATRAAAEAGHASAFEARGFPDGRPQERSFEDLLATLIESRAELAGLAGRAAQAGSPADRTVATILNDGDPRAAVTAQRTGGAIGAEAPLRSAGTPRPSAEAAARTGDADLGPVTGSVPEASVEPAAEAAPPRNRTVARIFNEEGFFTPAAAQRTKQAAPSSHSPLPKTPAPPADASGASGPTRHSPPATPAAAPAAAPVPPPRSCASLPQPVLAEAIVAPVFVSAGADGGAAACRQAPARDRPIIDHPAPRVPAPVHPAAAAARPERSAAGRIKGDARVEPRKPPAPAGSSGAGTANVQVTLRGGGAEASLVARVKALTAEDKARLRLEIAELLRRHGYGAVTLRLNGSSEPADRF